MEEKKYLVAILIIFFIERSETQLQKPVVNVIHLFNCNSLAYIVHTDIKCWFGKRREYASKLPNQVNNHFEKYLY